MYRTLPYYQTEQPFYFIPAKSELAAFLSVCCLFLLLNILPSGTLAVSSYDIELIASDITDSENRNGRFRYYSDSVEDDTDQFNINTPRIQYPVSSTSNNLFNVVLSATNTFLIADFTDWFLNQIVSIYNNQPAAVLFIPLFILHHSWKSFIS
jgi:hypothetical protein